GILVGAHCLSARTAGQLHLDSACAAVVAAALLASDAWAQRPSTRRWLGLAALLTLGLFTKFSCLPILALPAVAAWGRREPGTRPWPRLVAALALAVVPLLAIGAFLARVHALHVGGIDLAHLRESWELRSDQLLAFALEMALLVQLFPLVAWGA